MAYSGKGKHQPGLGGVDSINQCHLVFTRLGSFRYDKRPGKVLAEGFAVPFQGVTAR